MAKKGSEARNLADPEAEKLKTQVEGRQEREATPDAAPETAVGTTVETKTADGSAVELTVVGEVGGEQVLATPEGKVTTAPEGQAERRERSLMTVADIVSTYDSLSQQLLDTNVEEADRKKYEQAIAGRKAMSVLKAAGSETPNDIVQAELNAVLKMGDEELALAQRTPTLSELKVAAREAQMDLSEAQDLNERSRADARLVSAALEIQAREQQLRMEAKEKKAESDAEVAARTEGFIAPAYSELYEGGADAVHARIAAIEGEIENLKAIEKNSPRDAIRESLDMQLEDLYDERQKHRAVLPFLETAKQLSDVIGDIKSRENDEIERQKAELQSEILTLKRKKTSYKGHLGKLRQKLQLGKMLTDPTGWASYISAEIFGQGEEDIEEPGEEQVAAVEKMQLYSGKIEDFDARMEKLGEVEIDFSLDGERNAAHAKYHDELLKMARDGQVDAVKEFVAFKLGLESTTEAERAALEQTLDDIEDPKHELFAKGMRVEVQPFDDAPDLKVAGTVVGFNLKGDKVRVRMEKNGLVMQWDDELVTDIGTPEARQEMLGEFEEGGRVRIETGERPQTGEIVKIRENGLIEVQHKDGEIGVYDPEVVTNLAEAVVTTGESVHPWDKESGEHPYWQTIVAGIEISVGWAGSYKDFTIHLPQIELSKGWEMDPPVSDKIIRLTRRPEVAKQVFDFAVEAARDAKDVYDLYNKVDEFARDLPYETEEEMAAWESEASGPSMELNEGQRDFIQAKLDQYRARVAAGASSAPYQAPESSFWNGHTDSLAKLEVASALLEGSVSKEAVRDRVREQVPGDDARVDYYVNNAWNVIEAYNTGNLSEIRGMEPVEQSPEEEPQVITDVEDESGEQVGIEGDIAPVEAQSDADFEAEMDRWEEAFVEEQVSVSADVIAAAKAELDVSDEELDGIKANFEKIKGQLIANEISGGDKISLEALGLPETWDDFLKLGKSADRGFFKKIIGGQSEMQKGIGKLAEAAQSAFGQADLKAPSKAQERLAAIRARAEKAPSHVFQVKI